MYRSEYVNCNIKQSAVVQTFTLLMLSVHNVWYIFGFYTGNVKKKIVNLSRNIKDSSVYLGNTLILSSGPVRKGFQKYIMDRVR